MSLRLELSGRNVSLKKKDPSNIFTEHFVNSTHRFNRDTNVDLLHACTKSRLLNKLEKLEILEHKNSTMYSYFIIIILYDQSLIAPILLPDNSP